MPNEWAVAMNDLTAIDLDEDRFAIGQPVPRAEDPVLVRGAGHYSDDFSRPGQAYAVMVRSPYAHGVIRGIDTAEARAVPGVLAVYTAADLEAGGIVPMPSRLFITWRADAAAGSPCLGHR